MKILAVDTSSAICSVALLDDDKLIDEINLDNGRTHSENLMPLVDEIIRKNDLAVNDIEFIACCVGPGSFTGIRIGVSSIKAIAEVLKFKLAQVTSLETLAANVENEETIVSLIDARNNQVYCGIFDKEYNLKEEALADDINEAINHIKQYNGVVITGNGIEVHKELLEKELINVKFAEENRQLAKNVGKIGYKKLKENAVENADTIIPIYLRKSQAERLKK